MQDHDLDAPNLDTVRKPVGRSRLFLEDDPSTSPEDTDASVSLEDDASMGVKPPATKRIFRAVFLLVFMVLAGVGGALAWRSFGGQATNMIATKPIASTEELQQQLKSIANDLAAVRQTLEQQSAANHDQLTRIQEQIAEQSIALQSTKQALSEMLVSPPSADKPVPIPPRKPVQHPPQPSAQQSSKPLQVSPPQSLSSPKQ